MAIGIKWRALPCDFPPWRTLYGFLTRRFARWAQVLLRRWVLERTFGWISRRR